MPNDSGKVTNADIMTEVSKLKASVDRLDRLVPRVEALEEWRDRWATSLGTLLGGQNESRERTQLLLQRSEHTESMLRELLRKVGQVEIKLDERPCLTGECAVPKEPNE